MAAEVLATYPDVAMTVTDFDVAMVDAARDRLEPFGERVNAREADATALPFDDATFDVVLAWVMLHHTIRWEQALAEALRVVQPGGHIVGYDLLLDGWGDGDQTSVRQWRQQRCKRARPDRRDSPRFRGYGAGWDGVVVRSPRE